jgi:hypothetical protein
MLRALTEERDMTRVVVLERLLEKLLDRQLEGQLEGSRFDFILPIALRMSAFRGPGSDPHKA